MRGDGTLCFKPMEDGLNDIKDEAKTRSSILQQHLSLRTSLSIFLDRAVESELRRTHQRNIGSHDDWIGRQEYMKLNGESNKFSTWIANASGAPTSGSSGGWGRDYHKA